MGGKVLIFQRSQKYLHKYRAESFVISQLQVALRSELKPLRSSVSEI